MDGGPHPAGAVKRKKPAHDGAATVGQGEGKEATAAAKKTKPDR
jgi:hypothetical protein